MELILWRHAEAQAGSPDLSRALTAKGHKQAWKMAEWLDVNLPNSCKIFCSPATRAIQTAEALGRKFKILEALAPDTPIDSVLTAVRWPSARDPVLIVGHQPYLGQIAAHLIGSEQRDWTIRKANVWWIAQRERVDDASQNQVCNYLRAVMAPDLVRQ